MQCDQCDAHCLDRETGMPNYRIRRHPSPTYPWASSHIHYCTYCAYLHDYREIAKIMTGFTEVSAG